MADRLNTVFCFRRPESGGYIGGLVTLCNDYIDKAALFEKNDVTVSCFNYCLPTHGGWRKITNSKMQNIAYGIMQISALKKFLRTSPHSIIHIHTSRKALFFKDVLLADSVRKYCKGKIVMTIHVGDIQTVFHNDATKCLLIKRMNRSIDKILFLSDRMRRQFVDAGLEESRTMVLYNFYNIKPVAPANKEFQTVPRILFLGSINREKGVIELLNAARLINTDFHLDICGTIIEESIRQEFDKLISDLSDKVTYHSYIDKETKERLLIKTDILVLPSYREGLPISILEAMATSCGIVTTPVGAIPEILGSENAIIVNPRDIDGLKDALTELLTNPNRLDTMKRVNFETSKSFNDVAHIDKLCSLYR